MEEYAKQEGPVQNLPNHIISWEIHPEPMRGNKKTLNVPTKRWGHSTVLYRHYLYLFGGNLSNNFHSNNQSVYSFDLRAWGEASWERFHPGETDPCPTGRDGHSATVIEHGMIIVGGSKGDNPTSEVWAFDLRNQQCRFGSSQGARKCFLEIK